MISFAAKLRQSYLLPPGAAPEEQSKQSEAWTASILYAALLHDVGKIVADLRVEIKDGKTWFAWEHKNLFELGQKYRFKYIKVRDYHLHPTLGGLLAQILLPKFALSWLADYPEAFSALMYFISGHYDRAGVLGEIIQRADQASVAHNLGGDLNKIQEHPQTSLPKQIVIALRHLLTQDLKLNTPGADGWLTQDALWLVSKNIADKIRAYLMQQGISVPSSNSRLFDEMQSHKLIETTSDNKAIWRCKIKADDGWTPDIEFTLLKFSPSLIWEHFDQRPKIFAGTVIPQQEQLEKEVENLDDIISNLQVQPSSNLSTELKLQLPPQSEEAISEEKTDEYTFALNLFADNISSEHNTPVIKKDETTISPVPAVIDKELPSNEFSENKKINLTHNNPYKDDEDSHSSNQEQKTITIENNFEHDKVSADNFIFWIRHGLATNKLEINSSSAKIHIVKSHVFLASPAIFQQFVLEQLGNKDKSAWKALQNEFQRLKIHKKQPGKNGDTGLNIWTCLVAGPRKQSEIKGYLIEDTSIFFSNRKVPFDNLYLTLKEPQNEELQSS